MSEPAIETGFAGGAKQDPEALELRGRPRPVVRFRRGVIVGGAAAIAAGLATVAWLALDPSGLRVSGDADAETAPARGGMPDALAGAPRSYGDVPRLGPALPGDLGRPILEHQRRLEEQSAEQALPAAEDSAREAAETARRAARSSPVMVQISGGGAGQSAAGTADLPQARARGTGGTGSDPDPLGGSSAVQRPASPWTLSAGAVIPASLITGFNSDLPGAVLAQVTENVRDSATGRTVLIPQGARLIGSYDSIVAYGQRRAMFVWQRIVLPDGSSIALDDLPAADLGGYSGIEDEVDFHTWQLLKGVGLSTLLGVGTEIGLGADEGDLVRAVREAAQQNTARAGDQITARNLDIRPTITVRPGWPVRAIVNKDLVLEPWRS